jgi:TRAP-type mannitol/chloroaromatic compound transport system permease small subunit
MAGLAHWIDRCLAATLAVLRWLTLPVVLLLFLQWPLRAIFGAFSREANDVGQWMFALLVAASVTAATRSGVHLAADGLARHYTARTRRRLAVSAILLALIPWAVFVVISSRGQVLASLQQRELFPDTLDPGYFIIKLALWLLPLLMLMQAVVDLVGIRRSGDAGDAGGAQT